MAGQHNGSAASGRKRRYKRKKSGRIYRLLIILILIIGSFVLLEKGHELWIIHTDMQKTLEKEEELRREHDELQERHDELQQKETIEEEARKQFGLARPGEIPYKR